MKSTEISKQEVSSESIKDGKYKYTVKKLLRGLLSKDLYGPPFLVQIPMYFILSVIMFFIFSMMNFIWTMIYALLIIILVFISALVAQKAEHCHLRRFEFTLFFYTSIFCSTLVMIVGIRGLLDLIRVVLILCFGSLGITFSLLTLTTWAQRESKRKSIGFEDNFLNKMEEHWSDRLKDYSTAEEAKEIIQEAKYISNLFDGGMFVLAFLWSCNTVEKLVDVITDILISIDQRNKIYLLNEKGNRLPYTKRLIFIGFCEKDVDELWNKIRNKIAHHNYIPNFEETCKAIAFLRFFLNNFNYELHLHQRVTGGEVPEVPKS